MFVVITKPKVFHFQDKDDFHRPSSKPTHQVWLKFFFWQTLTVSLFFSRPLLQYFHVLSLCLANSKDWEDFLPEFISVHLNRAKPSHTRASCAASVLPLSTPSSKMPQRHNILTAPWLQLLTVPTERSMLIEKEAEIADTFLRSTSFFRHSQGT